MLLAVLFRVNLPVAAFATFYPNPFTIVPLYLLAYEIGIRVSGGEHAAVVPSFPEVHWQDWFGEVWGWLMARGQPLLIGLPLLFNEIARLGRKSGKNPIGAIRDTGGIKVWQVAGFLCLAVCFFVFSYYSVIAGWTLAYIFTELTNIQVDFQEFNIKIPMYVIPLTFLFMLSTILIVLGGVW